MALDFWNQLLGTRNTHRLLFLSTLEANRNTSGTGNRPRFGGRGECHTYRSLDCGDQGSFLKGASVHTGPGSAVEETVSITASWHTVNHLLIEISEMSRLLSQSTQKFIIITGCFSLILEVRGNIFQQNRSSTTGEWTTEETLHQHEEETAAFPRSHRSTGMILVE